MAANKIKSHAKINLVLNITGKGFLLHRIESVVAFVSLHDVISIKKITQIIIKSYLAECLQIILEK